MVCLPTERQTGCNKQFNYRNMNLDVMHSGDWSLIGPSLKSTNSYRHNGRKATDCCWNFHRTQRQDVITGGRYATTEEKTRNFQWHKNTIQLSMPTQCTLYMCWPHSTLSLAASGNTHCDNEVVSQQASWDTLLSLGTLNWAIRQPTTNRRPIGRIWAAHGSPAGGRKALGS